MTMTFGPLSTLSRKNLTQSPNDYSEFSYADIRAEDDAELDFDMADETIVEFNVGGVIFETLESSLQNPKRVIAKLRDKAFLLRHWDRSRQQYFFDRDPEPFQAVLNYMRTGILHLPSDMCSPQITAELIYWGLPRIAIEPCCWRKFSIGINSLENLRKLENSRQPAYTNGGSLLAHKRQAGNCLSNLKTSCWYCVSDPGWSKVAKCYNVISIMFVLVSISSFALMSIPSISGNTKKMSTLGAMLNDVSSGRITKAVTVLYIIDFICFMFFSFEMAFFMWTHPDISGFLHSYTAVIEFTALAPDVFNVILIMLCLQENSNMVVKDVEIGRTFLVFRILRLFRLFRLVSRIPTLMIIVYSFFASCKDLFSVLLVVIISSIFFAGCIHYVNEGDVFTSIPEALWWAIVTMTTCGYGDMLPTGLLGKLIGVLCAFSGVLLLGIMAPTLVHNFVSYYYLFRYMADRESAFIKEVRKKERQKGNELFIVDP